uniref:NADH-ubiquinone oxidoreductase chain 4 n=1 Tax=Osteocephalus aff. leoniae DO-2022 TaxID=2951407 RepID=A0A9E8S9W1_9NEOB|nr:NADH dehydrogenase subunit 4 [Osteocephalus aff. leoniae DO-2022]
MLIFLICVLTLFTSAWLASIKNMWMIITTQAMIIGLCSMAWIHAQDHFQFMNSYFFIDKISSPLLLLTWWLITPTVLASEHQLSKEPISRQRAYIFTIILLQITILLAFMADNLFLFFILFEATLIPTLIVITRLGSQKERMLAGTYVLFYTLFSSINLLSALLYVYKMFGTLSMTLIKNMSFEFYPSACMLAFWFACFASFLTKMPLYGIHLWLPKAHVEAPIAGSMILAGALLKLGGYGILRMGALINDSFLPAATPFIIVSLFGVLLSTALSARQTDLKCMIAFSSVSHMGLVIAGSMLKTDWGIQGAMILMISHGLTSSAMFCLVNALYERTQSRTMMILQGTQIVIPLMAACWLLMVLMNMALPPFPNFFGELLIMCSLVEWSNKLFFILSSTVIFMTIFSLFILWSIQRKHLPPLTKLIPPIETREQMIFILHIVPLLLLLFKPFFSS